MEYSIQTEYRNLLAKKHSVNMELKRLPVGYISQKTIKGKKQFYLQRRVGEKMSSIYIRADEVQNMRHALEQRAKYEEEKEQIGERLAKLEQAAVLIGKGLPCSFMVMKLSAGMDELQPDQRMRCSSFASAMNAVEGVMVSAETEKEIQRWHTGEKSFQAVFESTLQRYGFPIGDEA